MSSTAMWGSPVNQEQIQAVNIRLAKEIKTSLTDAATVVADATHELARAMDDAARRSDQTNTQLLTLNKRLFYLEWVLGLLAFAGVVLAGAQVWLAMGK